MSDKPVTRVVVYVVIDQCGAVLESFAKQTDADASARTSLTSTVTGGWMTGLATKKRRVVRCEGTY